MVNRVLVANIRAYCKVTKFSLVVKIITDKTLYQGNSNFKYEQINVNRYECDVKIVQDFFFTIGVNFLQVSMYWLRIR